MLRFQVSSARTFRWFLNNSAALLLIALVSLPATAQFTSSKRRPDSGPQPKNIHGVVLDARGKPIVGAHVFVKDLKTNIIRTLTTDATGAYQIFALTPSVDYEVNADYKGKSSEKKLISSYLDRQDNVLNFQLDIAIIGDGGADGAGSGPQFDTFDLVRIHGSFDVPTGVPAPIPAVVLLHGFGEDRTVWDALKKQLLLRGWAVMALDLRGHGESTTKNQQTIKADPSWRTSAHEFPLDLDPALDWLKSQPRIANRKIVVIGYDIGADLALIASGRFPEVRTVVAINPKLSESLAMAGSAQDFSPRSALILTSNEAEGNQIKATVKDPAKLQTISVTGGTVAWIGNKTVMDTLLQWLQQTY